MVENEELKSLIRKDRKFREPQFSIGDKTLYPLWMLSKIMPIDGLTVRTKNKHFVRMG
jgi:hypothetical protein